MERLAEKLSLSWREMGKFKAVASRFDRPAGDVWLLLPQTYMNLSGEAVGPFARSKGIPPERVLVVHDDLNLPLGKLLFKKGGGDGGHNGLRSISQTLGTKNYPRLRFGIGRPPDPRITVVNYVLSNPFPEERELWEKSVEQGAEMLLYCCENGLDRAMHYWHSPTEKRKNREKE